MIKTLEYYNPIELEALDCIAPIDEVEQQAEIDHLETIPEYHQLTGE